MIGKLSRMSSTAEQRSTVRTVTGPFRSVDRSNHLTVNIKLVIPNLILLHRKVLAV